MRKPRIVLGVVIAAVALVLGACTGLPTSGEPHEFAIEVPAREPIGQYGSGPQEGSEPAVLVDDFLRACSAGAFDEYATAKKYLLPETADKWRPTEQVVVYPTASAPSTKVPKIDDSTASVTIEVPAVATVNNGGILHELPGEGEATLTFELAKDAEGEWRISELDDGLVLSQNAFTTGFVNYDLYFTSTTRDALVADPRWLPRSRTPSHLVSAILAGPNEVLEEAVISDVAAGLVLSPAGVEVRDRIAYVDLYGDSQTNTDDRTLLMWQIGQTLRQVPNVQATLVSVNSVNLDPQTTPMGPKYALERLVAVSEGALVIGWESAADEVLSSDLVPEGAAFPAIGPLEDSPAAWLGSDEVVYVLRGREALSSVQVSDASWPSIDRFGNIWVTGNEGRSLYFINEDDQLNEVANPLSNTLLRDVKVSPDGARIALIGQGDDGGTLWVGTLAPGEDGSFHIVSVQSVERVLGDVLDVTWVGSTTLSALVRGEDSDAAPQVVNVPLGGWLSKFSGPLDSVWICSGEPGGVIVQREDQTAFQRSGAAWRDLGNAREYVNSAG